MARAALRGVAPGESSRQSDDFSGEGASAIAVGALLQLVGARHGELVGQRLGVPECIQGLLNVPTFS